MIRKATCRILIAALLLIAFGCGLNSPSPTATLDTAIYANPDIRNRSLVVNDVDQGDCYAGSADECKAQWCAARRGQQELKESIPVNIGNPDAVLYLVLGVHTCDDKLVRDPNRFTAGSANIRRLQNLLSERGGKMTFQVTKRWVEYERELDTGTLAWLAQQGSEIGLHIHEEYLLPAYLDIPYESVTDVPALAQAQPESVWIGAFRQLKEEVETTSGVEVTGFSGAPYCDQRFAIAAQAGLSVNYNYKNPYSHISDARMSVLNPWRPAGSATVEEMASYDRNGPIIHIPSGVLPVHCRDVEGIPTPFNYSSFDYVTFLLKKSLEHAAPDRVNVFSVTFHPWDFEGDADFYLWQEWLTQVIDPLVESGRVKWSTFGEVADLYETWEEEHIPR